MDQHFLAALKGLEQERSPHLIEVAARLLAERFLERKAMIDAVVDLVGVHVFAENDFRVLDPGKRRIAVRMSSAIRKAKLAAHQYVGNRKST